MIADPTRVEIALTRRRALSAVAAAVLSFNILVPTPAVAQETGSPTGEGRRAAAREVARRRRQGPVGRLALLVQAIFNRVAATAAFRGRPPADMYPTVLQVLGRLGLVLTRPVPFPPGARTAEEVALAIFRALPAHVQATLETLVATILATYFSPEEVARALPQAELPNLPPPPPEMDLAALDLPDPGPPAPPVVDTCCVEP